MVEILFWILLNRMSPLMIRNTVVSYRPDTICFTWFFMAVILPGQQGDSIGRISDASLPALTTPDNSSWNQFLFNCPVSDRSMGLLDFEPSASPVITWGSVESGTFCHSLEAGYGEVVHWWGNSFKIPSGNFVKKIVLELARLFFSAGEGSSLELNYFKSYLYFFVVVFL